MSESQAEGYPFLKDSIYHCQSSGLDLEIARIMEKQGSCTSLDVEDLAEVESHEHSDYDDLDPKNWSCLKKSFLFLALMSSSILADGGMTWGSSLIVPQAQEWNITTQHSSTSLNYGILLQGIGGVFAVPLIEAYGRLPIWLWPQVITMCMVLGATLSTNWAMFTAFRSLQGFFGTVPQVIGLPIIYDMYMPREWPRMINIWGTTFLLGPYVGPAIAGYIGYGTGWRISFAVLTALYSFSTICIVVFGHEAYYARTRRTQRASRKASFFGMGNMDVPIRATLLVWSRVIVRYIFKLPMFLTGLTVLATFTWGIGIVTTIDQFLQSPPYSFNTIESSSMRFAGIIGSLCGFLSGYFFNEWIFKARHTHWRPEYRLHGVWFPTTCLVGGLLTYGLTLHFEKHWIGLAFGWVLVNVGMVANIVAITAYVLEKYPEQATCVSAIMNMWRTSGGFSVAYFQPAWIARNGIGLVFGLQAVVVAAAVVLTVAPVMALAKHGVD